MIIGVVSQKGGVGKSTLARLIAREYAAAKWDVLIADMDVSQATSFNWNSRRLSAGIEPNLAVMQFSTVQNALKQGQKHDLVVFDGAPHATRATQQIADASNLVILPASNSKEDLDPQILLAHELVENGIEPEKICFVLSRISTSSSQTESAQRYVKRAGYHMIEHVIEEKTGYQLALVDGKTLNETQYPSLNEKSLNTVQEIVNYIESITQKNG